MFQGGDQEVPVKRLGGNAVVGMSKDITKRGQVAGDVVGRIVEDRGHQVTASSSPAAQGLDLLAVDEIGSDLRLVEPPLMRDRGRRRTRLDQARGKVTAQGGVGE